MPSPIHSDSIEGLFPRWLPSRFADRRARSLTTREICILICAGSTFRPKAGRRNVSVCEAKQGKALHVRSTFPHLFPEIARTI